MSNSIAILQSDTEIDSRSLFDIVPYAILTVMSDVRCPSSSQLLLSMRRRGVPADEVTMNSILDGLVSCYPPRVREAETVLELMAGWGLKPNQVRWQ